MRDDDVKEMIRQAAHDGARAALEEIGLHDELAGSDVKELRGLLDAWRAARKTALETFVRSVTVAALSVLVFGIWMKWRS